MTDYWNHNTAFHPEVLAALPARNSDVLDIGCGDGLCSRSSHQELGASPASTHLLTELRGGKAASTVARAKTTLSALFTYADEQGLLHQPHPMRTMKKIPELGTVALRAVSPNETPSPGRVTAVLATLRQRRSDIVDVFEFMSLTGVRWGELRAIRVHWFSGVPLPQLNVERSHSDRYEGENPEVLARHSAGAASPRALAIFRHYATGKAAEEFGRSGGHLGVTSKGPSLGL